MLHDVFYDTDVLLIPVGFGSLGGRALDGNFCGDDR